MALLPKIEECVTKGCKGISIKEITGVYDVTTNPTGWGAPNLAPSDPNFIATVNVLINGVATNYNVTSQIPNPVIGDFFIDIDQVIPDGITTVAYTVSLGTAITRKVAQVKIFSYCTVRCCVYKKMMELVDLDPCKDATKLLSYMYMWSLYENMIELAKGCDVDGASDVLVRLQKLCGVTTLVDCGCQ